MIRSIAVAALFVSLAMASAVCAQDELVGTWELILGPEEEVEGGEHLTLEADHTFRIVFEDEIGPEFLNGEFVEEGEGDVGSFDIEDEELPDIPLFQEAFSLTVVIRGTWEAEDGELTLRFEEIEIALNNMSVEEFLVAAARDLAIVLAEEQEIAAEEFEEFETAVVTLFLLELDSEDLEAVFKEGLGDVEENEDISAYEIDGNSMVFFEDDEVAAEFRRVTESVVAESSWGHVKKAATLR